MFIAKKSRNLGRQYIHIDRISVPVSVEEEKPKSEKKPAQKKQAKANEAKKEENNEE